MTDLIDLVDVARHHRAIADAADESGLAVDCLDDGDTRTAAGHLLEAAGHIIENDVLRGGVRALARLHWMPGRNKPNQSERAAAVEALEAVLDCEREEKAEAA